MPGSRLIRLVLAIAVSLAVGAVAVRAQASDPELIQGCVQSGTGLVEIIGGDAQCGPDEIAVRWAVRPVGDPLSPLARFSPTVFG